MIVNTIVVDNSAPASGGILSEGDSLSAVVNSIVWGNSPPGPGVVDGAGAVTTVDYSDVEGWAGGGIGNIDIGPLFVGPGNYRLQGTSPAREVGDNTAVVPDTFDVDEDGNTTEPTPDLDGRDRISGIVDMGAYEMLLPTISPGGFVAAEGDAGSVVYNLPVTLSSPQPVPVSFDWNTLDIPANPSVAHPGTDYVDASGSLTFLPGETVKNIPIEVLGDTVDEPPLLYGEWGLVQITSVSFAILTGGLFGLGLYIIIDDD